MTNSRGSTVKRSIDGGSTSSGYRPYFDRRLTISTVQPNCPSIYSRPRRGSRSMPSRRRERPCNITLP